MYSDRTDFYPSPKLTATSIICSHEIRENYIQLRERPKMAFLEWAGVGFGKFSSVTVGSAIPHLKGLCTHILANSFQVFMIHMSRVPQNVKF